MQIHKHLLITALLTTGAMPVPLLAESTLHSDAALPFKMQEDSTGAPHGQMIPDEITRYSRIAPGVGTSGMIYSGGMEALADNGFKTVVSLLSESEGAGVHSGWAVNAGIRFHNLPVEEGVPDDAALEAFRKIMANPENYPVMVYCSDASRTAALWARYRIAMGVPGEVALQEGRTIGLKPAMEDSLREKHGL